MIVSPCCRIIRSSCISSPGLLRPRLVYLSPSHIKILSNHARLFVTKNRQSNTPYSSFIIDTRKSAQRDSEASKVQTDLNDILKDQPPSVQLRLVDAYRKGFQSSTEKEKASKKIETVATLLGKFAIIGVCVYFVIKLSNKVFGGAFPKMLDPSVASFAENADVNFNDVQGVPFLYVSGSSFEEVFVGLGASRVRQLFAAAKQNSPCLIFIDEIDSVGRNRTSSPHHPYANQTINQLLAEMDGFQSTEGIIVLGATNQAEDLDKALLRPGRFDVQIFVSPPTYEVSYRIFVQS
ncbi:unnamed protein product [Trichobilharzia regenti]|nr:unnamed protein product [Trichobilharzia regenti]